MEHTQEYIHTHVYTNEKWISREHNLAIISKIY